MRDKKQSTLINRAEQAVPSFNFLPDPHPDRVAPVNFPREEAIDDSSSVFVFVRRIIIRPTLSGTRLEKHMHTEQ